MDLVNTYKALADESRLRILKILSQGYFNVQEITAVLSLSQPTVSHHLKTLQQAGLIHSKRDGTWIFYSLNGEGSTPSTELIKSFLAASEHANGNLGPQLKLDNQSVSSIIQKRKDTARNYFDSIADRWSVLREEAIGDETLLDFVSKSININETVLDLGCGDGALLKKILPRKGQTIAIDHSPAMLNAARVQLGGISADVDFRLGELEHLPLANSVIDHALAMMVFHHIIHPEEALLDIARVLKDGGKLTIIDLVSHTDEAMREKFLHAWLGFSEKEFSDWLLRAGFKEINWEILPFSGGKKIFMLNAYKK